MSASAGGVAPGWQWGADTDQGEDGRRGSEQDGASTTAGGPVEQRPVVVWQAANQLEAEIVRGRLESEDIPAMIAGEALGHVYGLTIGQLASTDVLVPAALAEKAMEILSTDYDWGDDPELDENGG